MTASCARWPMPFAPAAGIEKSNRVEVTLTHRNGAPVYSEWFNSALTDASHVGSMMSLVQDVTTPKPCRIAAAQVSPP